MCFRKVFAFIAETSLGRKQSQTVSTLELFFPLISTLTITGCKLLLRAFGKERH